MSITIAFTDDPARALSEARSFLESEPVLHQVIHSLLVERTVKPQPGRYWIAQNGAFTRGVVFQSPLEFSVGVTTMDQDSIVQAVDAIALQGVVLPGVNGDALTASRFAGQWTERTKSRATPFAGQRLYELVKLAPPRPGPGRLRRAEEKDRALVVDWIRRFHEELGESMHAVERLFDQRPYYVWEDGAPASIVCHTEPVAGVVRVSCVYTPEERRTSGHATRAVAALSDQLLRAGHRPMLYTDLANPISNSIYRSLGYRAVAEALRYRFG